jgi:PAS domain S-box-containing protein
MDENFMQFLKEMVESLMPEELRLVVDRIPELPKDSLSRIESLMAGLVKEAPLPERQSELIEWARSLSSRKELVRRFHEEFNDLASEWGLAKTNFEAAATYVLFSDTSPDGVFVKDLSNKYALVNQAMAKLLERRKSEIIGRTDKDLYGEEAALETDKAFASALKGDIISTRRTRTINGKTKTFLEIVFAKQDANNEPVGVCGICRRITGHKMPSEFTQIDDKRFPSVAMTKVLQDSLLVARVDSIVLLTGESGSGKDWLARYIHEHSARSGKPYYSINCAAIAPELAESELFGHETGAYTGAGSRKRGLLELSEGGTLLLNEIGELPLAKQAKLLTFLDTCSFTRVGGEKTVTVNARLIAATNRDLAQEVNTGRFRLDLFQRLNVFQIRMPALRERTEDIPTLAQVLLTDLAPKMKLPSPPAIDAEAMEKLRCYDWPGNVRELRNVLERAIIKSHGSTITVDALDFESEANARPQTEPPIQPPLKPLSHLGDNLKKMYEEVCLRFDEKAGQELGEPGSATAIATILGCRRETVRRRLSRLGCPTVARSGLSEDTMADLIRRLEDWLARHGFDLGRALR